MLDRPLVPLTCALALAALAAPPSPACVEHVPEGGFATDVATVGERIELLWYGSLEQRRELATYSSAHFRAWATPIDESERETLAEQVASLRRWLRAERDPLVLAGVLDHLSRVDLVELTPLFVDALEHDSPDVRRVGVERFVRFPDDRAADLLEVLHADEPRPRIRIDLALALAAAGDDRDAALYRDWLESGTRTYVEAGFRALSQLGDEVVLEAALRLADGDDELAVAALDVLAANPDSAAAVRTLMRVAGRDDYRGFTARRGLARLGTDAADERLLELASTPERAGAILAAVILGAPATPRTAALTRRLSESAKIVDLAANVETHPAVQSRRVEVDVAAPIARARRSGLEPVRSDPRFDRPWRVAADGERSTVSCAVPAELGGWPGVTRRAPVGTEITNAWNVSEPGDTAWVTAELAGGVTCWIPDDRLEPAVEDDAVESAGTRPADAPAEYDVSGLAPANEAVRKLEAAGAIEVFDVRDGAFAVRIVSADEDERDRIEDVLEQEVERAISGE